MHSGPKLHYEANVQIQFELVSNQALYYGILSCAVSWLPWPQILQCMTASIASLLSAAQTDFFASTAPPGSYTRFKYWSDNVLQWFVMSVEFVAKANTECNWHMHISSWRFWVILGWCWEPGKNSFGDCLWWNDFKDLSRWNLWACSIKFLLFLYSVAACKHRKVDDRTGKIQGQRHSLP